MTATATAAQTLIIYIAAYGGWNWNKKGTGYVKVTFTGPDADATAANYISTHRHLVIDANEDATEDWDAFPLTMAALFPLCEHQMDANLCHGPNHFPSADWERMQWGD